MLQLIASDLDGTLLPHGQQALEPAVLAAIAALNARGIRFCVLSGRSGPDLAGFFSSLPQSPIFGCENGALVFAGDRVLCQFPLPRPLCRELTAQLLAEPEGGVSLTTAAGCFVITQNEEFVRRVDAGLSPAAPSRRVGATEDIPGEIVKLSAWFGGRAEDARARFAPVWTRYVNLRVSGEWLEFSRAHKGTALAQITAALGISPADVLALGNDMEDIPLFRFAGDSCAAPSAPAAVQQAAARPAQAPAALLLALAGQS